MKKLAILLLLPLVGCASSSGYIPLQSVSLDEAGKTVATVGGYTKDASVAKEHEVHETLRNRDNNYRAAHAASGFSMEFAMVEVAPGVSAYMPKTISFKEAPHFDQILPVKPSEHPVWNFAESTLNTIAKYSLIGWGISEVSGVLRAGFDQAGSTYHGPLINSQNTAGTHQEFGANGGYYAGDFAGAPAEEEIPEGEWYNGIVGCSSQESFEQGLCAEGP